MSQEADRLSLAKEGMDGLLASGKVDEATYFKQIVVLAHGWIMLGDKEEASDLISDLTSKYNDLRLPAHMQEDPVFHAQALAVARALHPDIGDETDAEIELLLLKAPAAQA